MSKVMPTPKMRNNNWRIESRCSYLSSSDHDLVHVPWQTSHFSCKKACNRSIWCRKWLWFIASSRLHSLCCDLWSIKLTMPQAQGYQFDISSPWVDTTKQRFNNIFSCSYQTQWNNSFRKKVNPTLTLVNLPFLGRRSFLASWIIMKLTHFE